MLTRMFALLILLMTVTGCCQEKDLPLSPALASWIPYVHQQEVTFQNAAGQKLVFLPELSHFNQEGSDKVCGSYDIETRQVTLSARDDPGFQVQVTLSHEILVGIKVLRTNPSGLGLDIRYNTLSEHLISDPWRDKYFQEISLNGKTYYQVLLAYGTTGAGPLSFSEIYYGKDAGLIGFKLFSGETYFRE
jgi:hypothetical protein